MLTVGLIRDKLQAHLALSRVGKQPPSSAPTSLPVWTRSSIDTTLPLARETEHLLVEVALGDGASARQLRISRASAFAI